MLAECEPIVGGVDNESVVQDAEVIQFFDNSADEVIICLKSTQPGSVKGVDIVDLGCVELV